MSKPVFDTLVAGDDLSLATSGATFANANAGVGKTVTLQDVELVGADAGNYVLNAPVTATATIDQRALTVSGITASDKVYDGKTTASLV
ncbi:YDG domain-containing protein, partial [Acinetobacter baumannii]